MQLFMNSIDSKENRYFKTCTCDRGCGWISPNSRGYIKILSCLAIQISEAFLYDEVVKGHSVRYSLDD